MSAPRKYSDGIYEAVIARYQKRRETLKEIASSLEVNYHVVIKWVTNWRKGNDRKPCQSVER